jgi:hypothetical protein
LFAAIDPILASTTPPPAALGRTLNNPKSLLGDEDHASNLLPSPLWEMDEQPVAKTVTTCKPVDTISDTGYAGPLQPIVKQLTSLVAEKLALFAVDRVCDGTVRFGTMGCASLDSETADYMLMQVEREIDEGISRFWELYKFLKPEETFIENMPDEVKDLLVEWKNVQDNLPPLTVMDVMASHRDVLRDKGQRH